MEMLKNSHFPEIRNWPSLGSPAARTRRRLALTAFGALVFWAGAAGAQQPCALSAVPPVLAAPHQAAAGALRADPLAPAWNKAGSSELHRDCTHTRDYPDLLTTVRAFWTDSAIYFLFEAPYRTLNLFLPVHGPGDRDKLWDRDVVEIFLGADTANTNRYREFEIAPTGDHVDLAISYDLQKYDQSWNSGWQTLARIDSANHRWYAAARIPLAAVSNSPVRPGTRWRINLYRIDGEGPDSDRRFLCWRPTCVVNRDPNHVPEAFGTLIFQGDAQ